MGSFEPQYLLSPPGQRHNLLCEPGGLAGQGATEGATAPGRGKPRVTEPAFGATRENRSISALLASDRSIHKTGPENFRYGLGQQVCRTHSRLISPRVQAGLRPGGWQGESLGRCEKCALVPLALVRGLRLFDGNDIDSIEVLRLGLQTRLDTAYQ